MKKKVLIIAGILTVAFIAFLVSSTQLFKGNFAIFEDLSSGSDGRDINTKLNDFEDDDDSGREEGILIDQLPEFPLLPGGGGDDDDATNTQTSFVEFTITDEAGRKVTNLAESDFTVVEYSQSPTIHSFFKVDNKYTFELTSDDGPQGDQYNIQISKPGYITEFEVSVASPGGVTTTENVIIKNTYLFEVTDAETGAPITSGINIDTEAKLDCETHLGDGIYSCEIHEDSQGLAFNVNHTDYETYSSNCCAGFEITNTTVVPVLMNKIQEEAMVRVHITNANGDPIRGLDFENFKTEETDPILSVSEKNSYELNGVTQNVHVYELTVDQSIGEKVTVLAWNMPGYVNRTNNTSQTLKSPIEAEHDDMIPDIAHRVNVQTATGDAITDASVTLDNGVSCFYLTASSNGGYGCETDLNTGELSASVKAPGFENGTVTLAERKEHSDPQVSASVSMNETVLATTQGYLSFKVTEAEGDTGLEGLIKDNFDLNGVNSDLFTLTDEGNGDYQLLLSYLPFTTITVSETAYESSDVNVDDFPFETESEADSNRFNVSLNKSSASNPTLACTNVDLTPNSYSIQTGASETISLTVEVDADDDFDTNTVSILPNWIPDWLVQIPMWIGQVFSHEEEEVQLAEILTWNGELELTTTSTSSVFEDGTQSNNSISIALSGASNTVNVNIVGAQAGDLITASIKGEETQCSDQLSIGTDSSSNETPDDTNTEPETNTDPDPEPTTVAAECETSFSDIPSGIWYENPVCLLEKEDWVNGIEPGIYDGDGLVTRAQATAMVLRSIGLPDSIGFSYPAVDYPDVSESDWYNPTYRTAKTIGVERTFDGVAVGANEPATREFIAIAWMRANVDEFVIPDVETYCNDMTNNDASAYAFTYMRQNGVMEGNPDGSCRDQDFLNRAEMAELIYNGALTEGRL